MRINGWVEEKTGRKIRDLIPAGGLSADARLVLDQVLRRYVEVLILQGLAENMASEQSARMVAMRNATDNAQELIDDLTLTYNKVRQANITREMIEIATGASST